MREFWIALGKDGEHELLYEAPPKDKIQFYDGYNADTFYAVEIVHVKEVKESQ